jgi:L-malate glycosyltransferase
MVKVLHITAHLGGGVGRVIGNIALFRKRVYSDIEDIIVCLEPPHNRQLISKLQEAGVIVEISPDKEILDELINIADIVQLEWWHHPLLEQWMFTKGFLNSRIVVWSHTSGLHYPAIPASLIFFPHLFLFTSHISQSHYNHITSNNVNVVHSSGGFEDIPIFQRDFSNRRLVFGYIGTMNPAKLHPCINHFIASVDIPNFSVEFYGDPHPYFELGTKFNDNLEISGKINIRGYTDNLLAVMQKMDVLIYILNPTHYGTTENGLLEAMACGVVPIVLNNPIESSIVKDGETGFIVDSPASFAHAIKKLQDFPQLRQKLSESAISDVRARYSIEITERQLMEHYYHLLEIPKQRFDMSYLLGSTPWEWFSSCLGDYKFLFSLEDADSLRKQRLDLLVLYDRSKGSVFQFREYFPDDPMLKKWSKILEEDLATILPS